MFSAAHPDLRDQTRARELPQRALLIGIHDQSATARARLDDGLDDAVAAVVGMTHLARVARDQHEGVTSGARRLFERMFVS